MKNSAWIGAVLCVCLALAVPAGACNVPVFRYALERWPPGVYEVVVFHRGALSPADKKVVDSLVKRAAGEGAPCNIDVLAVDVAGTIPPDVEPVWKSQSAEPLPRLAACYPRRFGPPVIAWSGPLTAANAAMLVDSPVRRTVVRGIVAGASAVWVLLESGDKAKDAAAEKLLRVELAKLEKELKLPAAPTGPADDVGPVARTDGPGLKVSFSLVRLSRAAREEAAFIDMLLHTEDDLAGKYAGEPMAFAIFGQGRAMFALVGKGITADNIGGVCGFLVGRCSCQVKEQNPGVDMLFTADWQAAFDDRPATAPELPEVITPAAVGAATTAPAAPAADPTTAPAAAGFSPLVRNALVALALVAIAAAALVVWVGKRGASEPR